MRQVTYPKYAHDQRNNNYTTPSRRKYFSECISSRTLSRDLYSDKSDEDEIEFENDRKKSAGSRKSVQFQDEALTFSPPRIPRDGPSHLIWEIFAKEREERQRQQR